MHFRAGSILLATTLVIATPQPAAAAVATGLDGASMGVIWAVPFIGLLLSIAAGPLFYRRVWEHHYGKITAGWALLTVAPLVLSAGAGAAATAVTATLAHDYIPFIIVLFTLFTVAGGLLVQGDVRGTPTTNTVILAIGTVIASIVGTTGASMILIRPLLRANIDRRHNVHVVVFFIFLVSNIGGGLTPLGDPPLFVGFLRGVDFFWTTHNLIQEVAFVAGILLALFYALDRFLYARESEELKQQHAKGSAAVTLKGAINIALLVAIIALIIWTAKLPLGVAAIVFGVDITWSQLMRDGLLLGIAALSLQWTADEHREINGFSWEPIKEVAKLFAGIFICIIPVLAMLAAGRRGSFAWLLSAVTADDGSPHEAAYFWLTGALSSFLDNAPTYLVFFELAGGDPLKLMGALAPTLAAISLGAVFMGANTYIGNAPNFMVYAIAREAGVEMPSFFGYMLWSGAILLPIFGLVTWIFIGLF